MIGLRDVGALRAHPELPSRDQHEDKARPFRDQEVSVAPPFRDQIGVLGRRLEMCELPELRLGIPTDWDETELLSYRVSPVRRTPLAVRDRADRLPPPVLVRRYRPLLDRLREPQAVLHGGQH